jgi:hypothetical protein
MPRRPNYSGKWSYTVLDTEFKKKNELPLSPDHHTVFSFLCLVVLPLLLLLFLYTYRARGRTSCAPRSRNCISCVPSCQPQHDELRPAVSKELRQLHRKLWVYKMSNNWKVLTQFYCTVLYTQLYPHIQNCWMIPTTQLLYRVTV